MSTGIQWTDETWNPIRGCSRVSAGCENCYAEKVAKRFSGPGQPYEGLVNRHGAWNGTIKVVEDKMQVPLRWTKPRMVFVNSMSDLFHENIAYETIDQVFAVMAASPTHTFQILTKRPERMLAYMCARREVTGYWLENASRDLGWSEESGCSLANYVHGWSRWASMPDDGNPLDGSRPYWPLPNVWLGVSVEDQATADERIPLLLDTPAAVRWVSYEPALGPVDFNHIRTPTCDYWPLYDVTVVPGEHGTGVETPCPSINWIVVGGESGPGARPCNLEWISNTVEACKEAGVPVFVKQIGSRPVMETPLIKGLLPVAHSDRKGGDMEDWPAEIRVREYPA